MQREQSSLKSAVRFLRVTTRFTYLAAWLTFLPGCSFAQQGTIVWNSQERPIADQIDKLRAIPDGQRGHATQELALEIRRLTATPNKVALANNLANLSTEGDFGRDTLQEVATTLADALREQPAPVEKDQPSEPYVELAELVRYEHVQATLDSSQFAAAMAKLEMDDRHRQNADFALIDLGGRKWGLKDLRGKVVLVNFWATWCPPCRKEMPDLEDLYEQFKGEGLIILGISDENPDKVNSFLRGKGITYPVLLDPGRKVNNLFQVAGIPKNFVYDRSGQLVAESIDMRTRKQFLEMLARAGLK